MLVVEFRRRTDGEGELNRKYQWAKWFRRELFVLRRWVHYHCSSASMIQQLRNEACRRGLRVRVEDRGRTVRVEVRDGAGEAVRTNGEAEGSLFGR